ncbi:ATP-binding protein [Peribacillus sp. NPDC097264]|uniref:ATP-binding protein n=1 Tax=unclassified Peribacillus TaxID=2675266 RepID=UPI00382B9347
MPIKKIQVRQLNVKTLAQTVNEIMQEFEMFKVKDSSEFLFFNVKLVIWELLSNVIQHEGQDKADLEIEEEAFERISIKIHSFAGGFNWESYRKMECPDVSNEGGRGLYLIQQLCEFSFDEAGKRATAVFNVKEVVGAHASCPY